MMFLSCMFLVNKTLMCLLSFWLKRRASRLRSEPRWWWWTSWAGLASLVNQVMEVCVSQWITQRCCSRISVMNDCFSGFVGDQHFYSAVNAAAHTRSPLSSLSLHFLHLSMIFYRQCCVLQVFHRIYRRWRG